MDKNEVELKAHEELGEKNIKDEKKPEKKGKGKAKAEKPPKVSVFTLYRFSSWTERFMIFLGIIGGLGHGLIQPMFIMTFGDLIDTFSPTTTDPAELLDTLNGFILTLVYLGIAALFCAYFRTAMFVLVGQSQANKIRKEYVKAILRQEIGWYDGKLSGELTTRLSNDVPLIRDAISEKLGAMFYCISAFIAGYCISFSFGWKVGLVTLGGTPVLIITVALVGKALTMYSAKGQKLYAHAGTIAQEILGAVKTVMLFGGQEEEEKRYDAALEICEQTGRKKSYVESLSTSVPFLVGFCLYALALWYGSTLVYSGELSPGRVFIAFLCVTISSSSLGMMAPSIMSLSLGCGAAYGIFEIIDRKSKIDSLSTEGLKPETCQGNISMKDLKFTYPSRPDAQVLKGVSVEVKSGQTIALVGKSGSGKSTIIGLLERFYDIDEGSITIDGNPIKDLNVQWLRSKIGLVGQEPILFTGTIKENVKIAKEDATMEEIIQACKDANAHDFISALPDGYDTIVYQRGGNLSGGQKQRIAIARAIINNPQILLLDEATSALDSKSEVMVQAALDKASVGRSTITVAHRLSTIRNADVIHVFGKGVIIESGNHDELMALNGEYAKLVHLQSVAKKEEHDTHKVDEDQEVISKFAISKALEQEEELKAKKKQKVATSWYSLKKIFSNNWRHEWHLHIIGNFMGICQGLVFPAFSYIFTKILLALMLERGDELRKDVDFWAWILVVLGFGAMCVVYIQNLTFLTSLERYTRRLRYDLFSHIIRQKGAWFDEEGHEAAVFATILAQDCSIIPKASGKLVGQFLKIVSVIVGGAVIGLVSCWRLGLALIACVPLLSLGNYFKVRSIKGFATATRKAYEKSGVVAAEVIENARTVYALRLENKFLDRFVAEILVPEKIGKKDGQVSGAGYGYGECVQLLVFAFGFWYGSQNIKNGYCDIEQMFLAIMCVINTALVIGDTLHIFPDFQQALEGAMAFYELMVQEKEITGQVNGMTPTKCEGNIEFQEVRFAYPTRKDTEILRGFSSKVSKGQTLALVGHSGCGKSTTISLVDRLYTATGGNIYLDGIEIRKLDISWLRRQIGYVGQEPVVFARSIKENIAYGVEVTEEQIIEAAKKANAHDFITALPDGYNTYVGERGSQLSGGQKQRIAIARALVRDPTILLLDEATSALDSEAEKVVQEAINEARKGRTTIVIAHRLSTIKDADIISVVDRGQILETGTHNELIEKKGAYYNYVQAQTLEEH